MEYTIQQKREFLMQHYLPSRIQEQGKYIDLQLGYIFRNVDDKQRRLVMQMTLEQKLDYIKQHSKKLPMNSNEAGPSSRQYLRQEDSRPKEPPKWFSWVPISKGSPIDEINDSIKPLARNDQQRPELRKMQSDLSPKSKGFNIMPRALSMHFQTSKPVDTRQRSKSYGQPLPNLPSSTETNTDHLKENTPSWFILHLSDRNSSLKSLSRHLLSLESMLSLSGKGYINAFVNTLVKTKSSFGISGTMALEIALDRICVPRKTTYGDSIIPDEVRSQVIQCVKLIMKTDEGMDGVLRARGLIRQIVWCLRVPSNDQQQEMKVNATIRRAYINLRSMICDFFGPAFLLDEVLKEQVVSVFMEIQKHHNEPLPFFYLVASMNHPFSFLRSSIWLEMEGDVAFLADYSDIWNYRTKLFVLFNGLVSCSDSVQERSRTRRMVESCGLLAVAKSLMSQSPTVEFSSQLKMYEDDRNNDATEQESRFHNANITLESSNSMFQNLMLSLENLPDPEMARHFIISTILHLHDIVDMLTKKSLRANMGFRSDIGSVLSLIERATCSVADSVNSWKMNNQEESNERMEQLRNRFFDDIETPLYDLKQQHRIRDTRRMAKEIQDLREKYHKERARAESYCKQLSLFRSTDQSNSMTDPLEKPHYGLQPIRTEGLLESLPKDLLESPNHEIGHSESLRKLGKAAGIGMLWLEIQRLEELVHYLQEKKKGEVVMVEKVELAPKPPSPVPAPPPPPPAPLPPPPPPAPAPQLPKTSAQHALKIQDTTLKEKVPMKPLQWQKIPKHVASQTLWKKLSEEANELNVLNEIELLDLFQKAEQAKSAELLPNHKKKPEIVRLIDQKVAQNLEILLSSFKCSFEQIKDAFLQIQDDILPLERISCLKPLIPDSDTMEAILTYQGPLQQLGIAEQFMRCIYEVPRLTFRMDAMIYRLRYYQDIDEVEPDLNSLLSAITQIQTSRHLHMLLKIILLIGNYLNGNSFRGNAIGFKIDSLLSIKDTKASGYDSKYYPSLLHYIAKTVREHVPECLDFLEELPAVTSASKISFSSLIDCVKDLVQGFGDLQTEVEQVERIACLENDSFLIVFQPFRDTAKERISKLESDASKLQEALTELFELYGEDIKERMKEPRTFFETIVQFSNMFRNAHKDNLVLQEKRWKSMQLVLFQNEDPEDVQIPGDEVDHMGGADESLDEDALYENTIISPVYADQDPNETIKANDYAQSDVLELSSVLLVGGISMVETRNTLKRLKRPRKRVLSIEQDLSEGLSQLNSLGLESAEESLKRKSI